ncbi:MULTISPECIES: DUF4232 domain-containing protein [unclassified Streptomyces]|uniref:DUF4232 domain-containing protein n=1 Tax=unclassified Streptomyces TaxID=2593676 RepID=UPI00088EF4E0|nr:MULTISPECIES: DUF4232 domain-containing protein [unclassified Streptomyces]PBC83449.1 uncharacterized protein DUF4232 [Streptomyces sp. 2321.6]SDR42259.1 Protein of unknown function [Streptomyces sp. KS_16]SEC97023.1 Protein of unknown function [Streptomyces sp. 2133.1]SED30392.1 Protein of unknown function [Streptomyces sp. 2112.3]SEE77973.1 Protein of unknown function [Streptomyces sp. 2112.3]
MRTSRIRSAALAAVTAALALGLTACNGADGGTKAAGGDNAAGSAQSQSASGGGGTGGAEQANGGGDTKGSARSTTASGGTGEVAGKGTTAAAGQCRGDEMLLTAVHRFAGQQGDHLLVTATNKGTKPCWVTSYPAVKLGEAEGTALPHSKKDNPGGGKHLTLQPGGKAYTAVNLFDYGSKHQTAQSFALALRGADGHTGPSYSVALSGAKQQFSWNEADVLNWSTTKPYNF